MNLRDTITKRINEHVKNECKDKYFVEVTDWSYEIDRGGSGYCCSSYDYGYDDYVYVTYSRGVTPKGNKRHPGRWYYHGPLDEFIDMLDR